MSPSNSGDDSASGPPPEIADAARDLINHSEIVDVRPTRIEGGFTEGHGPKSRIATAQIEVASGYFCDIGAFSNRFEFTIRMRNSDDDLVARFAFDLIVDYRVDEEYAPMEDAADYVAATTGYFAAYPYARELLHSLSARLRMDPVVLGFLKKRPDGTTEMMSIGVLGRPSRDG